MQNASAAVYAAMVDGVGAAAPPPKWLCQAWMWHSNTKSWGDPQRKAFLSGVPSGGLVMLDLYAEVAPLYNATDNFYSLQPWIFSTIYNFGGRSGLYGRAGQVNEAVPAAVAYDATRGHGLLGIGASPEAIETDPIMYDLLYDCLLYTSPSPRD